MRGNPRQAIRIDNRALALLVENMSGLSASDTQRLARKAIFDHGAIQASDVPVVMRAKYEFLNRQGILRYEPDTAHFADVGGLANLKGWLEKRCAAFDGSAPQLDPPKGVLLLGVQGCGKSLAASACAGVFNVPLLRLDCAALFDKFVGESERNLRESLATADLLAPCVLWVDEIEKGFGVGDADGGAARRVLGAFLTWLADKKSRVFVVATANDIAALPPELIRKGRFDEIFFVDLPNAATRAEILAFNAAQARDYARMRRRSSKARPGMQRDFPGAEIEQAVVAAIYSANRTAPCARPRNLRAEIAATRPLAVVMAEKVEELRSWAEGRTSRRTDGGHHAAPLARRGGEPAPRTVRSDGRVDPLAERARPELSVRTTAGWFVLKIAKSDERREVLELQNAAIAHLRGEIEELDSPAPRRTVRGTEIAEMRDGRGRIHLARVFSWVEGCLSSTAIPHDPRLLGSLGRALARLDRSLQRFTHPAMHRALNWDLKRADQALPARGSSQHRERSLIDGRIAARASSAWPLCGMASSTATATTTTCWYAQARPARSWTSAIWSTRRWFATWRSVRLTPCSASAILYAPRAKSSAHIAGRSRSRPRRRKRYFR